MGSSKLQHNNICTLKMHFSHYNNTFEILRHIHKSNNIHQHHISDQLLLLGLKIFTLATKTHHPKSALLESSESVSSSSEYTDGVSVAAREFWSHEPELDCRESAAITSLSVLSENPDKEFDVDCVSACCWYLWEI